MLFGENIVIFGTNTVIFGENAMHSTGFEEQSATSEESATYLRRVRLIWSRVRLLSRVRLRMEQSENLESWLNGSGM